MAARHLAGTYSWTAGLRRLVRAPTLRCGRSPEAATPPTTGVIRDSAGNLFGTTGSSDAAPDGTIFWVPAGTGELVPLRMFGWHEGLPLASMIMDSHGNLFGTTYEGGAHNDGTVFEIDAGTHRFHTLQSFDGSNGANPQGKLIIDANGNLYGTTFYGGASGDGPVFRLDPNSDAITTIADFHGTDGAWPLAGLVADASGNLFGTTLAGGASGLGTVFELQDTGFAAPEPASLAGLGICGIGLLLRSTGRALHRAKASDSRNRKCFLGVV